MISLITLARWKANSARCKLLVPASFKCLCFTGSLAASKRALVVTDLTTSTTNMAGNLFSCIITQKLHFWYIGTYSEYMGQVHQLRSSRLQERKSVSKCPVRDQSNFWQPWSRNFIFGTQVYICIISRSRSSIKVKRSRSRSYKHK